MSAETHYWDWPSSLRNFKVLEPCMVSMATGTKEWHCLIKGDVLCLLPFLFYSCNSSCMACSICQVVWCKGVRQVVSHTRSLALFRGKTVISSAWAFLPYNRSQRRQSRCYMCFSKCSMQDIIKCSMPVVMALTPNTVGVMCIQVNGDD